MKITLQIILLELSECFDADTYKGVYLISTEWHLSFLAFQSRLFSSVFLCHIIVFSIFVLFVFKRYSLDDQCLETIREQKLHVCNPGDNLQCMSGLVAAGMTCSPWLGGKPRVTEQRLRCFRKVQQRIETSQWRLYLVEWVRYRSQLSLV
jgi:hypothetical protein